MINSLDITGVILAGGLNKRFPFLKPFIKIGNEKIIERTLKIFRKIFDDLIISTNTPEYFFYLGEKMVGDLYPFKGPLTGIFSSMINARYEKIFVVASDMPFIKKELIEYIIKINKKTNSQIVICYSEGKLHPLFGIYHKSLVTKIQKTLLSGKFKMLYFIIKEIEDTFIIDEDEIKILDPKGLNFVNINTIEDYKKFIGGGKCLV